CFRLNEPDPEDSPWLVNYLLQSTKDPSLLIDANDVWKPKQLTFQALANNAGAAREHLLVSLGQASALCRRVEASLKEASPSGYSTDAAGAHEFLRETAGALEQSGFGVMLPSWWTRRGGTARLTARATVKSGPKAPSGLSLETMLSFNWELALGDEK